MRKNDRKKKLIEKRKPLGGREKRNLSVEFGFMCHKSHSFNEKRSFKIHNENECLLFGANYAVKLYIYNHSYHLFTHID